MAKVFKYLLNTIPRPLLIRLSYVAKPILELVLRGHQYVDPIDEKSFKRFLPYGYGKQRQNVLSPSTLSLERHRLLWIYLKNETSFFSKPQKVLHFAPEQAFYNRFKNLSHIEYTTTDLESPLADVKADICNLPFNSNSFDTIFCNHVLEHIENDKKAMSELYRVLKPGGMAILQVPLDNTRKYTFEDNSITDRKERAAIFGQYDHVRIYGLDYFDTLIKIGFKVEALDYTKVIGKKQSDKYRLAYGELLPICRKPKSA